MACVDILLASYNGEKYIREQIDSILAQSYRDFRIIIRDDGSSDATPDIIREYESRFPGVVCVIADDARCGSAASNFFRLIKYAESDYIMFSDQDDYWLPDKIDVSLKEIRRAEEIIGHDRPVLAFGDYKAVDASLNPIPMKRKNMQVAGAEENLSFNQLLVQNYVTGCLIIANRSLYENMGDYSYDITMHDWWAALYACACGVVRHIPKVLMLYRQHVGNSVGANDVKSFKYRFKKLTDKNTRNLNHVYLRQAILFRDRYAEKLNEEVLRTLNDFIALHDKKSKLARVRALIKGGYLKSDWARILGQIFYI